MSDSQRKLVRVVLCVAAVYTLGDALYSATDKMQIVTVLTTAVFFAVAYFAFLSRAPRSRRS